MRSSPSDRARSASRRRPPRYASRGGNLVDDDDDGQVGLEGLAQHEAGLRERALGGIDHEDDTVDHRQASLDLAAEVGVAGGVDDVDGDAVSRPRACAAGPR